MGRRPKQKTGEETKPVKRKKEEPAKTIMDFADTTPDTKPEPPKQAEQKPQQVGDSFFKKTFEVCLDDGAYKMYRDGELIQTIPIKGSGKI
jgi:hypothetical protein